MLSGPDEVLHYHEESRLVHSHGYSGPHAHGPPSEEHEEEEVEEVGPGTPLSLLGLILVVYFLMVSPFGIETGVGAAGPLVFMGALGAVALLWSAPQAIVGAELSIRFGCNGGCVVWVQEAFGADSFIAFFNTCNVLLSSATNYALQIVVCVDYIGSLVHLTLWAQWGCRVGFILLALAVNLGGARWISRLNGPLLVLVTAPFVILLFYGSLGSASTWESFASVPPNVAWGPFVGTVVWAFGGADTIGSLAGDLGPKRLVLGLLLAFPLCLASFALAVVAAWGASPHVLLWRHGGFVAIAWHIAPWLGGCMVAAACLSSFGQFLSSLAAMGRFVWAAAQPGPGQLLPRALGYTWVGKSRVAHPLPAIGLAAVLCLACCALPFELAVQLFVLQRSLCLYSMYAAYICLRGTPVSAKDGQETAFQFPGGRLFAWLLVLPTVAISIASMVFVSDKLVWIVAGATECAIVAAFVTFKITEHWSYLKERLASRTWRNMACCNSCCASDKSLYRPIDKRHVQQ